MYRVGNLKVKRLKNRLFFPNGSLNGKKKFPNVLEYYFVYLFCSALKAKINQEWGAMSVDFIRKSCWSFRGFLEATLEARGDHIKWSLVNTMYNQLWKLVMILWNYQFDNDCLSDFVQRALLLNYPPCTCELGTTIKKYHSRTSITSWD